MRQVLLLGLLGVVVPLAGRGDIIQNSVVLAGLSESALDYEGLPDQPWLNCPSCANFNTDSVEWNVPTTGPAVTGTPFDFTSGANDLGATIQTVPAPEPRMTLVLNACVGALVLLAGAGMRRRNAP